jgi:hypothetical protein
VFSTQVSLIVTVLALTGTDIDVVWLESPLPYVTGRYDLWIQSDMDHPGSNPWAMLCVGMPPTTR